jgi:hypothetical protein
LKVECDFRFVYAWKRAFISLVDDAQIRGSLKACLVRLQNQSACVMRVSVMQAS